MERIQQAYQSFFRGGEPSLRLFSPYTVCPLGAHVDHQHGIVLGMALDKGIDMAFSPTADGMVKVRSLNFDGMADFNVSDQALQRSQNWSDYLKGAVWAMQQKHTLTHGVQGVVCGSVPSGGIASSAALLCGFIAALGRANNLPLKQTEIVRIASQAEREFVGLANGILDQSCVSLCERNQLLYLDTDTSEWAPIPFGGTVRENGALPFKIAIFFSGVTRSLTITDYNLRVQECCTAATILQAYENDRYTGNNILRRTNKAVYEKYVSVMPMRFARRARHFFTECERVEEGVEAWRLGLIEQFGELMFESCESSILNYECGSPELIALYRSLRHADGVYGARFCGAGFIGSCFALIDPAAEDDIRTKVISDYVQQFPMYKDSLRTFVCESHGGVRFINENV